MATRSPPPPLGMWMTSHRQCPRGSWCLRVQEWGCFSIFRRADDVTQTMSGGGVLVECLHPPPFRKSCIRACYLCKISGKSTPLPPPNQSVPIRLCTYLTQRTHYYYLLCNSITIILSHHMRFAKYYVNWL